VDKNQFISVLTRFSESSTEEAKAILSLKEQYPYSQLLHALSARVSRDHGFSLQQTELQTAAVYASDRAVLKDIVTGSYAGETTEAPVVATVVKTTTSVITDPVSAYRPTPVNDDLVNEVMHDLERLTELKHNFEMLFIDVPDSAIRTTTVIPAKEIQKQQHADVQEEKHNVVQEEKHIVRTPIITAPPVHADDEKTLSHDSDDGESKPRESSLSKKQRIVEIARAMNAAAESDGTRTHSPVKKNRKDNPEQSLIEEIRSTKEEIVPAGEKQKEQLEMIEQFIKIQPSISSQKEKLAAAPEGDLSSTKNGEFGDNIVSETLVDILLKQGKKEKAIEVLKKLIWKFPQKKAYFAAQIEDLKK